MYGDVDLLLLIRRLEAAHQRDGDRLVDIVFGFRRAFLAAACAFDGGIGV